MFKFRLQRVLQWKEQREQERATELATAQQGREAALERCESLRGARDEGMTRVAQVATASPTIGELRNLRLIVDRLNDAIEDAHQEAEVAEAEVRERMAAYTVAFQERKVLDRLREKGLESWAMEEAEADRRLMDSVALNGFVQRQAAESAAADAEG